eukprot:3678078-Rhodomonas_salina.2
MPFVHKAANDPTLPSSHNLPHKITAQNTVKPHAHHTMYTSLSIDESLFYIVPDVRSVFNQLEQDSFGFEDLYKSKVSDLQVDTLYVPVKVEDDWNAVAP